MKLLYIFFIQKWRSDSLSERGGRSPGCVLSGWIQRWTWRAARPERLSGWWRRSPDPPPLHPKTCESQRRSKSETFFPTVGLIKQQKPVDLLSGYGDEQRALTACCSPPLCFQVSQTCRRWLSSPSRWPSPWSAPGPALCSTVSTGEGKNE